ncbi:MAG: hypothetical protein CR982_10005 [Candidatus Cloacimonadota bacterium]|nr:MAG: hypothetical protein CR982_10005 [Candidatus Cloacimonadota bacterium]PIE81631.1 MAG: hypothetical protein CSA15_00475 [Candidatus Delongbacteria bacterium]
MNQTYLELLDPKFISKTSNLNIATRYILQGFMLGKHRSKFHGFSAEFSDRKPYVYGDNIRDIDWKLYGKTDRYFTKLYEDETNIYSYLFLDGSRSMQYLSKESVSKFRYAQYLAASIIRIMLSQNDSVALGLYGNKIEKFIPHKSGISNLTLFLKELSLSDFIDERGSENFYSSISDFITKRGMIFIFSDFLQPVETILDKLKGLKKSGNDIILFMINDSSEIEYNLKPGHRVKDMETGKIIEINSSRLIERYNEEFEAHRSKFREEAVSNEIDLIEIDTKTPFNIPLTEMVLLRGKRR